MTDNAAMVAENGEWLSRLCPGHGVQHETGEAFFDCEDVDGKRVWHLAFRGDGCNYYLGVPYKSWDDAAASLAAAGYEMDRPFDYDASAYKPVGVRLASAPVAEGVHA